MSVTLGLMLRIDGTPPAVAVPPQQLGERPVRPLIEAEKVVEITSISRANNARNNTVLAGYGGVPVPEQMPHGYSRKGASGESLPQLNGQLLNTYV